MNRVGDSAEPGARLINDFKDPVERTRDPTGYSGRCRDVHHSLDWLKTSTIDGNVEFVYSQVSVQLYSYVTSVNSVFVSDKIINNIVIILE